VSFIAIFIFGLTQDWASVLRVVGISCFVGPWFALLGADSAQQYQDLYSGQITHDLDWDEDAKKLGCLGAILKRVLPLIGVIVFGYCAFLAFSTIEFKSNQIVISFRFNSPDSVTDDDLRHVKEMTTLRELHLEGTQVTDKGLRQLSGLTALRELYLAGTHITDAGLKHLENFTQLEILDLNGTNVSDAGVEELQKALPKCNIRHGIAE